jgi:recombination protein RecR
MSFFSEPLERAIEALSQLPGVGRKSAQRFALHLLKQPLEDVLNLSQALEELKTKIEFCPRCHNLSTGGEECSICQNPKRTTGMVCIVPDLKELVAIEKTGEFKGRYHILNGLISPMDNVSPADLRISDLIRRLQNGEIISEVILAIPSSAEGEATAFYLNKLLKPLGINVSRLAYGIPLGAELEYIDDATLTRALSARLQI